MVFRCTKCGKELPPEEVKFEMLEVNASGGPTTFRQLSSVGKKLGRGFASIPVAPCPVPDCGGAMLAQD